MGVAVFDLPGAPMVEASLVGASALPSWMTLTRSTKAFYFNAAGVLTEAAVNEPRFEYDRVTLAPLGLAVENTITNYLRNPRCEGAVAGSPGTLPTNWGTTLSGSIVRTVVGTGTENGIPYVDVRFSGTTAGTGNITLTFDTVANSAPVVVGNSVTASQFLTLVAGSLPAFLQAPQMQVIEYDAGIVTKGTSTYIFSPALDGSALRTKRWSLTRTITDATSVWARHALYAQIATGITLDFTLRIGAPQIEVQSVMSSVILPAVSAPAATSRQQDVASMTITGTPLNNGVGNTLQVDYQLREPDAYGVIGGWSDGSFNNTSYMSTSASGMNVVKRIGGAGTSTLNGAYVATGAPEKIVAANDVDALRVSVNGGAVFTAARATLATYTNFGFMRSPWSAGSIPCGWLRRVRIWPYPKPDAALIAEST